MSFHGQHESEIAKEAVEKREAVQITHGYSKEKRPDLKQVVVTLITSQSSALPLWLEVLDGNSSDTNSFVSTVENYCEQMAGDNTPVLATFLIRAKNWVINLTLGSIS